MVRKNGGLIGPTQGGGSRAWIYALLVVFNGVLWTLLLAFRWEVSLRTREVEYFDRQLFPVGIHVVPMAAVVALCALLSAASVVMIVRDRIHLSQREKLRALLEQILESLETGVVVLDRKGQPMLANESARGILPRGGPGGAGPGLLDAVGGCPQLDAVIQSAVHEGAYTREKEQTLGPAEDAQTVRISTLPLKNRQGRADGTLVLVDNITDEIVLQRQMEDAERLSTMGTLAAALAHEIRNPLEALNLNLELLNRILGQIRIPPPERDRIEKYMRVFNREASRLAGVVENFLSFARPGSSATGSVGLDAVLRQVAELVENQAQSRGVSISVETGGGPIIVQGFEDRLKQLFLNLVINGIESMPGGGRLAIRAGILEPEGAGRPVAAVTVRDTGVGIPPGKLHRLFEPFFSMRAQGTGLGLTIAEHIARMHGGVIRVRSEPGKGSEFTVEFPADRS